MKTKILIGLTLLLVGGYLVWNYVKSVPIIPYTQINEDDLQVVSPPSVYGYVDFTLTFSDDNKKSFENIELDTPRTALEVLESIAKVEKKGEGTNAFVTSIDNVKADDAKKEFWAFYVNGKQAEVGAGSYTLKDKDTIEWKLETY